MYDAIAEGGMATVHFGRMHGEAGFSKTVAIKTLHGEYARDRNFVAMFLDEVRIAARIQHPNVVSVLDVVAEEQELFLVMEYVEGEALSRLMRAVRDDAQQRPSARVAAGIICGVLRGLAAAHEARDEDGTALDIIHRDVSPHNIMVGRDGVARLLDFGVAKISGQLQSTRSGYVKGKLGYMAPEQVAGDEIDHRADLYAAAGVFYEMLTGRPFRDGGDENVVYAQVISGYVRKPSDFVNDLPAGADDVVLKALAKRPAERYGSANDLVDAIENVFGVVSPREVTRWLESLAADVLSRRRELQKAVEADSATDIAAMDPNAILAGLPEPQTGTLPSRRGGSGQSAATRPTVRSVRASGATRQRLWLAAVALLLGGAAAAWMFRGHDKDGSPADGSATSEPSAHPTDSDTTSEAASAEAASTETASAETASVSPRPVTTVAVVPSASAAASSSASITPSAVRKVRPPKAKPTTNCDPPYTVTPAGTKRYKIECL